MSKQVHKVRREQLIQEVGIQVRTDNPATPEDSQLWYNTVEGLLKARIGSTTKQFAFAGESAGQTLYSTTVETSSELKAAVDAGLADTIYLRNGTYDLSTLASPGIKIERSLRLIGEKNAGDTGKKVRIITDSTHIINVEPLVSTIVNNNNVSVTNNSTTINLVGGVWSASLTGRYIFVDGVPYLIVTNPSTTQITVSRAFAGTTSASKTYFIASMVPEVRFENIEFIASGSVHNAITIKNAIKPVFNLCSFDSAASGVYGKINVQYSYFPVFTKCDFTRFKLDFVNNNYNAIIAENNFISSVSMLADPTISISTGAGVPSLETFFIVAQNIFSGPSAVFDIDDSSRNTFVSNVVNRAQTNPINLNSNSNNNVISNNSINGVSAGGTLIQINSSNNIVSSNRLVKSSGFAIELTGTAQGNTVMGNLITGGATISDSVAANLNRIEDDLSRIGDQPSGFGKDFIDHFNEVLEDLQNVPSGLIQINVAVQSGVIDESVVYWNTGSAQYRLADASAGGASASPVGFIRLLGATSGDLITHGQVRLVNSGNVNNAPLFNAANINQRFYLGTSGAVIPENQFLNSGVLTQPIILGQLIDVVGSGQIAEFFVNIQQDQKFGTPSESFTIGSINSTNKAFYARSSVSGDIGFVYNPLSSQWYVFNTHGISGEITQPFNSAAESNMLYSRVSGDLFSATTSLANVISHVAYVNGIKKDSVSGLLFAPDASFSGDVHVYNHSTSGVITSREFVNDAFLVGSVYNSGSVFSNSTLSTSANGGYRQTKPGSVFTPPTNSFTSIAYVYFTGISGSADVLVNAKVKGQADLQELFPYQNAEMKLQLNGSDVDGSLCISTIPYVSGETSYTTISESIVVSAYSNSGSINKLDLLVRYSEGGSTAPVTFTDAVLNIKTL